METAISFIEKKVPNNGISNEFNYKRHTYWIKKPFLPKDEAEQLAEKLREDTEHVIVVRYRDEPEEIAYFVYSR